jgi:hypothetical protein
MIGTDVDALLGRALERARTLIIFCGGKEFQITGTLRAPVGKVRTSCRETLEEALRAFLDEERRQRCPTCGLEKLLSQFARDSSRGSGRHKYCLICDKKRRS